MKLMIAAEGKTLEHTVSKKFGRATFFLEVDPETLACTPIENPGHAGKPAILKKAADDGVVAIITGNIGPHGFALLGANKMQAVFAPGMQAREAVTRYLRGDLKILDAPTIALSIEEHEQYKKQKRLEHTKHPSGKIPRQSKGSTPRGRYHLQQFGGRGH